MSKTKIRRGMNPCVELCLFQNGHVFDPNLDICKTCDFDWAVMERERLTVELESDKRKMSALKLEDV
jgi:hypothetical protein